MKHCVGLAFLKHWIRISSLFLGFASMGQDIAIGTWRTHFSYSDARILSVSTDKIFCATENGFFSREIGSGTTRNLSKIDGLSDAGISTMAYDTRENALVIGYGSGLVDFVLQDKIITVSDIANSNLEGDKEINDVVFSGNKTFLATDLGIVVLNTKDAEIIENYVQIGSGGNAVQIRDLTIRNDSLFALTDQGVQSGSLDLNLLDFNNWNRYSGTSGFNNLTRVGNSLYALSGSNLMVFSTDSWQDSGVDLPATASRLFEVDGTLVTATTDGDLFQLNDGLFNFILTTSASNINDLALVNDKFIIADGSMGLMDESGTNLSPDGPFSDSYSNIKVLANEVYAFHAPSPFGYDGLEKVSPYSFFSEGEWSLQTIDGFKNISDVTSFSGSRYFSSIGDGLYDEASDEIIKNIPSSSIFLDTILTAIKASERLWISGFHNQEPVHSMNSDNEWQSFSSTQLFDTEFLSVDLSQTGVVWLGTGSGTVTVLDVDQNLADQLSTSDGLPSFYTDIEISVEDNAWVSTLRGPALFPDASFVLSNTSAILPTFENRVLFEREEVNAILTDGGNRVWFGTNRGLWVFDENTSQQVALFNQTNSPLPSDKVLKLAYNGKNGEVFIVTDKGMISYRSASSIGSRIHGKVSVFPNPVRPDYQGQVGISGLARNATLKITDINGNLVKEIVSNGGSAAWDLMDVRGGKVVTGIYFFFSSTSDGEETFVGKIAVVR